MPPAKYIPRLTLTAPRGGFACDHPREPAGARGRRYRAWHRAVVVISPPAHGEYRKCQIRRDDPLGSDTRPAVIWLAARWIYQRLPLRQRRLALHSSTIAPFRSLRRPRKEAAGRRDSGALFCSVASNIQGDTLCLPGTARQPLVSGRTADRASPCRVLPPVGQRIAHIDLARQRRSRSPPARHL